VDDDSAVSIGKLLGANIVITGSITGVGSARRLRLKTLDVKTAEIVTMASEEKTGFRPFFPKPFVYDTARAL
jgi:curli biogenesis system outer membrane secretion channel CsgG